jgi:hypothetical protein
VIFLVEHADGLVFARTGDSNHRPAAEHLRAGAGARAWVYCAEAAWSAWTRGSETLTLARRRSRGFVSCAFL